HHFTRIDYLKALDARARQLRGRLQQLLRQKQKLQQNLQRDLQAHGDPESHKRMGDLLLANIGTATRNGRIIEITDYYSDGSPRIAIEVDENSTIQEEAGRRFRQYTKAKRAREEIAKRLKQLESQIAEIQGQQKEVDKFFETLDESGLDKIDWEPSTSAKQPQKRPEPKRIPGVRHYVSTDGYEILVGRAAAHNDNPTCAL